VVLFVLSGASLDFSGLETVTAVTMCFVVVRFPGQAVAILGLAAFRPARRGRRAAVSVAASDVGARGVMVYDTALLYPRFGANSRVCFPPCAPRLIGPACHAIRAAAGRGDASGNRAGAKRSPSLTWRAWTSALRKSLSVASRSSSAGARDDRDLAHEAGDLNRALRQAEVLARSSRRSR